MALQIKKQIWIVVLIIGFIFVFGSANPLKALSQETQAQDNKFLPRVAEIPVNLKIPSMSTRQTYETGDASLYIELNEVVKIRSSLAGLTSLERVNLIKQRLQDFLQKGGNPNDIKPGQEGNQIVIRAGEMAIVTVDSETAKKTYLSEKQLALLWTDLIRKSLRSEPLRRDIDLTSSRGFSPALAQLRDNFSSTGIILKGFASWYGPGFHGRRTASGERFNMHALTAAHKTLPLNTIVKVTNLWNGKSAVVRITDRGPFIAGRIIDLSKGAAQAVGMLSSGTAPVTVEVLGR